MFFDLDLRGDTLPPKTLCLTYDDGPGRTDGDGPGPKTAELGQFLADRGVAATFFVIGHHVREHPGIVARLRAGGHLIGNHTDTHPTLVSFVRDGGDVAAEIARADLAIGSPSKAGELTFFRAPYGYWRDDPTPDQEASTSLVARTLNAGGRFPHLVGPVGWDIDPMDWRCWRSGAAAEECGQTYLDAIEAEGRGIVLMHDSSETRAIRDGNLAFEMTRWLVPILQERGYQFVRLDQVPGVESASRVTRQVSFRSSLDQWLTIPAADNHLGLTTRNQSPGGRERFGVVPVEPTAEGEVVSLRAWNGNYLTARPSGSIGAEAVTITEATGWRLVPAALGSFRIETRDGQAVTLGSDPDSVRLARDHADSLRFEVTTVVEVAPL